MFNILNGDECFSGLGDTSINALLLGLLYYQKKHQMLSLGRSETLEFVTGQIRQPTAVPGEEIEAFSHFWAIDFGQLKYSLHSYRSKIAGKVNEFKCLRPPKRKYMGNVSSHRASRYPILSDQLIYRYIYLSEAMLRYPKVGRTSRTTTQLGNMSDFS